MDELVYNVVYKDFAGTEREAQVRVCRSGTYLPFYATDLGSALRQPEGHKVLGCGKYAETEELAVQQLVQDHGSMTSMELAP